MSLSRLLVIVGTGGHASDVLSVIEAINESRPTFEVVGLVGDDPPEKDRFSSRGVRYLGEPESLQDLEAAYVIGIGYPEGRQAMQDRLSDLAPVSDALVHPAASLGKEVPLGVGSVILANVSIMPLASCGDHVYVSHNAAIGHDTRLDDFVSVMPAANLSGDVHVGRAALIGAGSTTIQGIKIGAESIVGAGAVVVRDVPERVTVTGVPAKARTSE